MWELYGHEFDFVEGVDSPGTFEIIEQNNKTIVGGITQDLNMEIYYVGDHTPSHHIPELIATDPAFKFQEGDCYQLATELQDNTRVTGLASIVDMDTDDMVHAVAVLDNGLLVDSLGVWDETEMLHFWDKKMDSEGVTVGIDYDSLHGIKLDETRSQTYHQLIEIIATII